MLGWTVIWGNKFYKINDYWLNSYSGMTCGGHAYIVFENSYDYVLNKIDGYNQSDNALNLNPNNTNGLITCFTDKDHRCFIQKIYKDTNSQNFGNKEKIDNNDFIYSDRFNTWDIFHNNLPEYWEN